MIRDSVGNGGFSSSSTTSPAPVSPHPPAVGKLGGDFTRSEEEMDINSSLCDVSIASICNMIREDLIRGGGQIGANLVLGGVDPYTKHPVLTAIHPHGSMDVVPFTALGSGGLAAMGVLEACFKVDMTLEEGIELVKSAVVAGIKNDLGSGSQVDLVIIDPNGVKYERAVVEEETIKLSIADQELDDELYRRGNAFVDDEAGQVIDGVNGFGALPYQIKRRRMIIPDESILEKQKQEWIDKIISS